MHYKGTIMFKKIAIATSFALLASSAIAGDDTSGKYVGLEVGRAELGTAAKDATSVGVFAGYRFNRNFAIEGAFHGLGNFDFDNGAAGTVNKLSFAALGIMPLNDKFSLYGRAGIYAMNGDRAAPGSAFVGSAKSSGIALGVGMTYAFTSAISGRLEIQKTTHASDSDWKTLSAGLAFRF